MNMSVLRKYLEKFHFVGGVVHLRPHMCFPGCFRNPKTVLPMQSRVRAFGSLQPYIQDPLNASQF